MRLDLNRRGFLAAGAAGLLLPVRPALAGLWADSGFTHGVASGDPGPDSIKLWTRYAAPGGGAATLKVEVAADTGFRRIIARSEAVAGPDTWGTAQARVSGLPPKSWVYYRFTAPDGSKSPVGRTRALPSGRLSQFKIAVFSCSNKPFGWFNAYAHAAPRDDIDLVVHLGDYLYEYARGSYPSAAETMAGREIEGAGEMLDLDSYRQRYASYRVDPALQELHRRFPMVAIWDDHEFANDSWRGGAENHGADEGDWFKRKAIARQVHGEWLPGPDRIWQRYDIGDLVSLITLDTRIEGREQQLDLSAALKDGKPGLQRFKDGEWSAPGRTLLGTEQEAWVADTLKASLMGSGDEPRVQGTVDRVAKWAAQTPQMFRLGLLRPALITALSNPQATATITDEASAIEALGHSPRLVLGAFENFKLTWPGDFALAERLLATRSAPR